MIKVFGVKALNSEQIEAIWALTDPEIDLVILEGLAGSGKTLLTLAAGLEQVIKSKLYNKIVWTRAPVPIGLGLGFLPGTIDEKLTPWMLALIDNLEYLGLDMQDEKTSSIISLCSMEHMRGRSLTRKWLVVDEAQNISIQQMKVLLTRAGENTKIICLGDSDQTDNKTLSKTNNALYYLIHMANKPDFIKHIKLLECERSRLASWAATSIEV